MAVETERKFRVRGDGFLKDAVRAERIAQGYLSADPARTVRIRIKGGRGYLTVKGPGDPSGVRRGEWEYPIPEEDAQQLLALCPAGVIDKTRHYVPAGRHTFEVDVFEGDNRGLTVAEIELTRPDEPFERPEWLAEEVTGDSRYYNASLSAHPYKDWK